MSQPNSSLALEERFESMHRLVDSSQLDLPLEQWLELHAVVCRLRARSCDRARSRLGKFDVRLDGGSGHGGLQHRQYRQRLRAGLGNAICAAAPENRGRKLVRSPQGSARGHHDTRFPAPCRGKQAHARFLGFRVAMSRTRSWDGSCLSCPQRTRSSSMTSGQRLKVWPRG